MKKARIRKMTGIVEVEVRDRDPAEFIEIAASKYNFKKIFAAVGKETGLTPEFKIEKIATRDYETSDYIVVSLKTNTLNRVVVADSANSKSKGILRFPIAIRFNSSCLDRLTNFVAAVQKVAKNFEVDIKIIVVKELGN